MQNWHIMAKLIFSIQATLLDTRWSKLRIDLTTTLHNTNKATIMCSCVEIENDIINVSAPLAMRFSQIPHMAGMLTWQSGWPPTWRQRGEDHGFGKLSASGVSPVPAERWKKISVRVFWVFHPHKYDTNCETTHEEGIVTLNRLVLVLGKLSRRLAAFMATAFTSSFPSHKAPTYWSLTPLQGCETIQHSDSTSLDPHQFDHLVRWSECWYRRAVLFCAILVAPACWGGCGGPLFGIDSTAVNPSRNLRNHDVTVVFI